MSTQPTSAKQPTKTTSTSPPNKSNDKSEPGSIWSPEEIDNAWSVAQILFPEQIQRAKITRETLDPPPHNRVLLVWKALTIWDEYYKTTWVSAATEYTQPLADLITHHTGYMIPGGLSIRLQLAPTQASMLTAVIGPYFENNLPFPSSEEEKLKKLMGI